MINDLRFLLCGPTSLALSGRHVHGTVPHQER